jgi:hypothetical protein
MCSVVLLPLFLFLDSTTYTKAGSQQSTKQLLISIKELLDMLNNENIFLIDINKLKEIELYRSIKELEINFYQFFEPNSILSCGCFSHQLDSLLLEVSIYLIGLYLYNIDFISYIFK